MGKLELEFSTVVPKLKEEFETRLREEIIRALIAHNGNVAHSAKALGTHRTTLLMYVKKYGLEMYTVKYRRRVAQG